MLLNAKRENLARYLAEPEDAGQAFGGEVPEEEYVEQRGDLSEEEGEGEIPVEVVEISDPSTIERIVEDIAKQEEDEQQQQQQDQDEAAARQYDELLDEGE